MKKPGYHQPFELLSILHFTPIQHAGFRLLSTNKLLAKFRKQTMSHMLLTLLAIKTDF